MPNWCENTLTVRGEKDEVQKFVDLVKSTANETNKNKPCIFEALIPMPDELRGTQSPPRDEEFANMMTIKYGSADWYDWAVNNWGTKWGCVRLDIPDIEKGLDGQYFVDFTYETAWAPGDDQLEPMFVIWDKLDFFLSYEEPGMGFKGYLAVFKGETVGKNCIEIEYIPSNIDEVS